MSMYHKAGLGVYGKRSIKVSRGDIEGKRRDDQTRDDQGALHKKPGWKDGMSTAFQFGLTLL